MGLRTLLALGLLTGSIATNSVKADDWLPVSQDDLRMTSEPKAPGASAIFLYRQVDRDDAHCAEHDYERIKILSEEGRKYANIQIPYNKRLESVRDVEARTIQPDGTIVKFDGMVYDGTLAEGRGLRLRTASFTLPDVGVGSIIEYRYRRSLWCTGVISSRWILGGDLFTRLGKFSLERDPRFSLRWSWPHGVPEGADAPRLEKGVIRLEVHDVPAFVTEEVMPPANEMRYRVDFIYSQPGTTTKDAQEFWNKYAKNVATNMERFMDERKAMERVLAQVIQPADAPQAKLRKIYARVQQLRNLDYERQSDQEAAREQASDLHSVKDVWERGYGNAWQMTMLFIALARGAGFHVDPTVVSTRNLYFFDPRVMNALELDATIACVQLDGKDVFLAPGVPFAPFGLLPWPQTQAAALKVEQRPATWIYTPLPPASDSRIERSASLTLADSGTLTGKLTVRYSGIEAMWRRLDERNEDEIERRRFLEKELEREVPSGIEAKLVNSPDWTGADTPLVAEYEFSVPGWASRAGKRSLVPVGLFGAAQKHLFEHGQRVQPIYFHYPYTETDDLTIELPTGWTASSVPHEKSLDLKGLVYKSTVESSSHSLHMVRELKSSLTLVKPEAYPAVQTFFQTVRTGDEEQIVVSPDTRTTGK